MGEKVIWIPNKWIPNSTRWSKRLQFVWLSLLQTNLFWGNTRPRCQTCLVNPILIPFWRGLGVAYTKATRRRWGVAYLSCLPNGAEAEFTCGSGAHNGAPAHLQTIGLMQDHSSHYRSPRHFKAALRSPSVLTRTLENTSLLDNWNE